jgi:hypothetical protein
MDIGYEAVKAGAEQVTLCHRGGYDPHFITDDMSIISDARTDFCRFRKFSTTSKFLAFVSMANWLWTVW